MMLLIYNNAWHEPLYKHVQCIYVQRVTVFDIDVQLPPEPRDREIM